MPLLSAYSAMTIEDNGTSSSSSSTSTSTPSTFGETLSYATVYVSSTTYKVTVTYAAEGENLVYTIWILKDGTIVAVNVAGENFTGALASSYAAGALSGFIEQIEADSNIGLYTDTSYFHATGTSTVSIGPTTLTVTNYVANSLPITYTGCGSTDTLTAYAFSVGTPEGTSSPLVTYEHFAGTSVSEGTTTNYDDYLQVTSITLA